MGYPGGKGQEGVVQRIINQIPPHDVYVEAFAGSATVFRAIRPASRSVLVELDAEQARHLHRQFGRGSTSVVCDDAVRWLSRARLPATAVVYADPPYLPEVRSHRRIYRCELSTRDHRRLLRVVTALECRVLLSGYPSALYDRWLKDWRAIVYRVMTRGGIREEVLWCNFAEPQELHDYRYLGSGFRERERIRRQQRRWRRRLERMDRLQRLALMATLAGVGDGTWAYG